MAVSTISRSQADFSSTTMDIDADIEEVEEQASESTKSPEPFVLEGLAGKLLSSGGKAKQSIADEILNRIASSENAADRAAWVACVILRSHKPGRIDDCLGLFSRLDRGIVRDAITDAFAYRPPVLPLKRWITDYWYVLVHTMLRDVAESPQKDALIAIASNYPVDAIREAAVCALAGSTQEKHRSQLALIAENDPSFAIRQLATEAINELE